MTHLNRTQMRNRTHTNDRLGQDFKPTRWTMRVSTLLGLTVSIFMMVAENATTFAGQQEADAEPAALLSYNRDIRPILSENCFACHGSDRGRSGDGQTDLRLDLPEEAIGSAADVAAIVAGQPDQSEMWQRIIETDPDAVMPPPESKKKLTDKQKQTLRRWICLLYTSDAADE